MSFGRVCKPNLERYVDASLVAVVVVVVIVLDEVVLAPTPYPIVCLDHSLAVLSLFHTVPYSSTVLSTCTDYLLSKTFYVRDNGIDLSIINAIEAVATCLRSEEQYCVNVPDEAPSMKSLGF
jgi:hypothetical protein